MKKTSWSVQNHRSHPVVRGRRLAKPRIPRFEPLESRVMLDASTPPNLVVGRTLSSYFVGDIANHQETITFTVYNQSADDETGVLLTDTLASGTSLSSSSSPVEQNGQNQAWSLGTIQGYESASVTITLSLPNTTPTQLDAGASAYAELDGASISAATVAATLQPGSVGDPTLLAATPDANSNDPFVQEKAAELDYNPTQIFNFIQTSIGYESYTGSLRGARGVLWDGSGNSLDVASLGVALMRASGIPAQYSEGELPYANVQQLIASMFPPTNQVVGAVPSGTQTSDPVDDSRLLSETYTHYWFQFNAGSGMQDADPLIPGAQIGQTFAQSSQTFSAIDPSLRGTVEIKIVAEITNTADSLFGLSGASDTTVLDQTFNDVDLVGRPITFGNFVATSSIGFVISETVNTYTPYLIVGGDSLDPKSDPVITGTSYQETITNFPFGSQILTGLFMDITLASPTGSSSYSETLVDRIGAAARASGGTGPSFSVDPSASPIISPLDLTTVSFLAGQFDQTQLARYNNELAALSAELDQFQQANAGESLSDSNPMLGALAQQATDLLRAVFIETERSRIALYQSASDTYTSTFASEAVVKAYFDSPRITVIQSHAYTDSSGNFNADFEIDLLKDDIRAIAAPGQNSAATVGFLMERGIADTNFEATALNNGATTNTTVSTAIGAAGVIAQAQAQGIPMITLTPTDLAELEDLAIPDDAKLLISQALEAGDVVIVPTQSVMINGVPRTAWYQIDPTTGNTIGVLDNGSHGFVENLLYFVGYPLLQFEFGYLSAALTIGILDNVKKLLLGAGFAKLGFNANKAEALASLVAAVAQISAVVNTLEFRLPFFVLGYGLGLALGLKGLLKDPNVPDALIGANGTELPPSSTASAGVAAGTNSAGGQTQGTITAAAGEVSGSLSATWNTSQSTSAFAANSLTIASGQVAGPGGNVGTGTISLTTTDNVSLAITGAAGYSLSGAGSLSFFGQENQEVGAAGDWTNYQATVNGSIQITLTTDSLMLNGALLPAGTYTISTTAAALAGSGSSTTPTFAGPASITATQGTVSLDPGTGSIAVGGASPPPEDGLTLSGFSGTLSITPSGSLEAFTLNGSTTSFLQVTASTLTFTTDQNTPISFQILPNSNFADTYTLSAAAPEGWGVTIDSNGNVTVNPAAGLQSGTFPVELVAQSTTDPNLVQRSTVEVSITPTQPGITLQVAPDSQYTVPSNGAEIPTAFQAVITNTGPTADTFTISASNLPTGFTAFTSLATVTIPAGGTGIVGLYLQPTSTIPPAGTQLSFTVSATSTTDSSVTSSQNVAFTVPAIDAVTLSSNPTNTSVYPGGTSTVQVTITNAGNQTENVTFAPSSSSGLTVTGLSSITLTMGQSTTETVTISADSSVALNSSLQTAITAAFGASTQTLTLPVAVEAPGATAIANASAAANFLGNASLADRLNDLGVALTNLVQAPTSSVYLGEVVANINSIVTLLPSDPFLAGFTESFTSAETAISGATTAAEFQTAVSNLGTELGSFASTITDEYEHGFTIDLSPSVAIVQPGAPETFAIQLDNKGSVATTYDLSVSGLPSGVAYSFSQTSITLQPGQSLTAGNGAPVLTLTESGSTLTTANFTVTATAEGASEIALGASGSLTLRDETFLVSGVSATPPYTNAGGMVDVSAQIQAVVNEPTQVEASYTVADSNGNVLFTSQPTSVSLTTTSGLITTDLGMVDTTGFANGTDVITVTLADSGGDTLASGTGTLFIGQPVTGTITSTPSIIPTGSNTISSTLSVSTQASYPDPLSIQGTVSTPAPGTSVALFTSGGKTYAYESGTGGIDDVDVTDPTNPQLLEVFGQNDIVNGQFGFNVAKVVNGELIVGTSNGNNGSVFNLLVYSLTDPAAPTLVSNTTINYRFLDDLLVNSTGTAAFVPTSGFNYYGGSYIYNLFGDLVSIDLSDPTAPAFAESLFNDQGQPNGGDQENFGGTLVNDQIAYITGNTPGAGDVTNDTGNLMVVNIADPANMSVVTSLTIPGTINLLNVAVYGDRALVVGSAGTQSNDYNPNATGVANNLTLTVLDVSDPSNPKVLGSTLFVAPEQFPVGEAGAKTDVVSLGNGDFAVSDTDANGKPALLVVDPSDPDNIIVGAAEVPSGVHGITVSGDELYASTSSGLSIYQIQPLVSDPVAITVNLPAGTAANIVAGSFNVEPTQINTSSSGDSLVWDRTFAAGTTNYTFSWQTTVSGVTAGEVVPITTSTSIAYADFGVQGTLSLPGTSTTGAPIVSLTPSSTTAQPGGPLSYVIRLSNPTDSAATYQYTLTDAFGFFPGDYSGDIQVPAGGSIDIPFNTTVYTYASASHGADTVTVTAEDVIYNSGYTSKIADYKGSATASLNIVASTVVAPDPTARGVVVTIAPSQVDIGQDGTASFIVQVTNVGSSDDHFDLSISGLPTNAYGQFTNGYYLDVPAGAGNFVDVPLTITSYGNTSVGSYPLTVTATSASDTSISSTTAATLNVVSSGVTVYLNQDLGAPGDTYEMSVYNDGSATDTFDLSLAGAGAMGASLAEDKVTIAPNESQTIAISTSTAAYAIAGSLPLIAVATSETDPAVFGSDTASIVVGSTTGVAASFSPSAQVLPIPGTTSFELIVTNNGNDADSYSASITSVTGPVVASLETLTGGSGQSIPLFILPGFSSAAFLLDADVANALEQGSISVHVQSTTTADSSADVTALVNSQASAPPVPKATTSLTVSPSALVAGEALALKAIVTSDSGLPTGSVAFYVDGAPVGTSTLEVVNGVPTAVFQDPGLSAGPHTIQAVYGGSTTFAAGSPASANLMVSPATSGGGGSPGIVPVQPISVQSPPQLTQVFRYGFHWMHTTLVLQFNQALDPTRATDVHNYAILHDHGKRLTILSAVYDQAELTVTLQPKHRIDLHRGYELTVNGVAPFGLTSASGVYLDGSGAGVPGSSAFRIVDGYNLVLANGRRYNQPKFGSPHGLFAAKSGSKSTTPHLNGNASQRKSGSTLK